MQRCSVLGADMDGLVFMELMAHYWQMMLMKSCVSFFFLTLFKERSP